MRCLHVALLRGINVGGKNKLPMKDLAAMFAAAGCKDVKTYIQSGNVVFRADQRTAARLPTVIADAIEKQFGFRIAVLRRTAREMQRVAESNPFLKSGMDPDKLHVTFLSPDADTEAWSEVDGKPFLPEQVVVAGNEVYFYLPNGVGRAKLPVAFGAKLRGAGTMRNWRTVMAVMAMLEAESNKLNAFY